MPDDDSPPERDEEGQPRHQAKPLVTLKGDTLSFQARPISHADKPAFYRDLAEQAAALLTGERDAIANAANVSALLFQSMPDVNWAGFYFLRENDELVLGPFQGKPACVRIARGRGVCGAAVARGASILVPDVNAFPGHIACDS